MSGKDNNTIITHMMKQMMAMLNNLSSNIIGQSQTDMNKNNQDFNEKIG
jgi:hypothetical protein